MTGNSHQPTVRNRAELPKGVSLDNGGFPILPDLEIVRRIDAGGFGTCWLAKQHPFERHVAVKMLHAELSDDPQFVDRFKREMKILADFRHNHIVQIYTASVKPPLYYVMEFVGNDNNDSQTLADILQNNGQLDVATVKRWALQIIDALHYAHQKGVIHRDIKPQNILLMQNRTVKVADFGIAKLNADTIKGIETNTQPKAVTNTGSSFGTWDYMAPEQQENAKDVDERSDIYSVGALFYRMLTGRKAKERSRNTFRKQCPDVPAAWEELLEEMLEPDREDRLQTMEKVLKRINNIDQIVHQVHPPEKSNVHEDEFVRIQREREALEAEEQRLLQEHEERQAKEAAEKEKQKRLAAAQRELEEKKQRIETLKRGEMLSPQPSARNKADDRMALSIKGVDYAFRWCPPGRFMMGSPSSEADRLDSETQHEVTLSRGFWMLETQVTQQMWESVMGNNPSYFKGSKKLPVEQVSWNDSQEYIKKLNTLLAGTPGAPAGYKFSLPTESQWEYACRAGTTTAYHFGNSLSAEQANFNGNISQTREVGSYPSNVWGLYDMHGNVYEWCLDWYGDYPSGSLTDPVGSPTGSIRVVRGGSWHLIARYCRSAFRSSYDPAAGRYSIGLRLSLVFE